MNTLRKLRRQMDIIVSEVSPLDSSEQAGLPGRLSAAAC